MNTAFAFGAPVSLSLPSSQAQYLCAILMTQPRVLPSLLIICRSATVPFDRAGPADVAINCHQPRHRPW